MKHTVNILLIGPSKSGKSRIANFLADLNYDLPQDLQPTKTLRIVEFDINNADVDGIKCDIDVQLWDTTGNDMYNYYWAVYKSFANGIVFVYSPENDNDLRKIETMYNYFVNGRNLNHRALLLCSLDNNGQQVGRAKKSINLSRISEVNVNLDIQGEKFKQDFIKYVVSVVKTVK